MSKTNRLFFANVSSHIAKSIVNNPQSVIQKEDKKKIVISKGSVAYGDGKTSGTATPNLTQT